MNRGYPSEITTPVHSVWPYTLSPGAFGNADTQQPCHVQYYQATRTVVPLAETTHRLAILSVTGDFYDLKKIERKN
ncbi:hypothetical protein DAPPUDRAFT_233925 [Daphnia pulex]|uniref:Uncharacterized protein n=1 Tax=Daphnia pulex TaxID=6669 RepID=E9FW46_DAPPU|nr:hypothetical protein DAPPUDRAFT_233925 [Daphnia pulex]|eukprot:EFX88659.1 hypothetical protein DAPPUDRAFT_233925 [Daphnia pulex]